jgi:hypothetical protein
VSQGIPVSDITLNRPSGRRRRATALDLSVLLPSWEVSLRADHKSRETLKSYTTGIYQFLDWYEGNGRTPALDRDLVRMWVADLI